ncbi:MAG: protein adenylyltransferase SelO [Ilumatobacteraceae bacterium]
MSFTFDNTFVRELDGLYVPWEAAHAAAPELLALDADLAVELGATADELRSPEGVAMLVGNTAPSGAEPVAMAYAGHQFGGYSPQLGDGRALLLGEIIDRSGRRRDIHLKGSGRTPFARGGDGRATVGPMLREYVISAAMFALGVPTTRSLAVVATGDDVARETMLPGAVLVRVAASHLRVGTFQFAAAQGDPTLVRRLADYAIGRHYPDAADEPNPSLALFDRVLDAQASLVARWMALGFIHGVMNTDNVTISGETIDYGPCAFMDVFDPATVFSSIDHGGRYAYGNQPMITQWNLARFAETLLALFDDDVDTAVEIATARLQQFPDRYHEYWMAAMGAKLGLSDRRAGDDDLVPDLLDLMAAQRADYSTTFRALASGGLEDPTFADWIERWSARLAETGDDRVSVAAAMNGVNPVYIPRNHLVEEALTAATAGDLEPFQQLVDVLAQPYDERPGLERYALPADPDFAAGFRTFCGT